jgi:hypothetical protein
MSLDWSNTDSLKISALPLVSDVVLSTLKRECRLFREISSASKVCNYFCKNELTHVIVDESSIVPDSLSSVTFLYESAAERERDAR